MADSRVAIVGGGFAGLFTAMELTSRGIDCVLLDAASAPGGVARTIARDGYELEPGAGTLLLPHPHLGRLFSLADVEPLPAVDGGVRWVHTRGRLVEIPPSPKVLAAPIAPLRHKARAALEPFIPRGNDPDETVGSFLRRRLGPGVGDMLAWIASSGVFAGDPHRLSIRSAFPTFPELEDLGGSIVRGALRRRRTRSTPSRGRPVGHILPPGGMAAAADRCAASLADRYKPNSVVERISRIGEEWFVQGDHPLRVEQVVVATRPRTAASLLGGALPAAVGNPPTAPVVVVGLGGPVGDLPLPRGFGVLTGPDVGTATLGILFESSYAPLRAPDGNALVKVIAGGATRPEVVDWDDDTLRNTIVEEVGRILGTSIAPTFVEIVRHRVGIPQYNVGHATWLQGVDAATPPAAYLTGWAYRGVGVAHLASDAVRVASAIVASR